MFDVVLVREAVVSENVAVVPQLLDDGRAVCLDALAFCLEGVRGTCGYACRRCRPLDDARSAAIRSRSADAGCRRWSLAKDELARRRCRGEDRGTKRALHASLSALSARQRCLLKADQGDRSGRPQQQSGAARSWLGRYGNQECVRKSWATVKIERMFQGRLLNLLVPSIHRAMSTARYVRPCVETTLANVELVREKLAVIIGTRGYGLHASRSIFPSPMIASSRRTG